MGRGEASLICGENRVITSKVIWPMVTEACSQGRLEGRKWAALLRNTGKKERIGETIGSFEWCNLKDPQSEKRRFADTGFLSEIWLKYAPNGDKRVKARTVQQLIHLPRDPRVLQQTAYRT